MAATGQHPRGFYEIEDRGVAGIAGAADAGAAAGITGAGGVTLAGQGGAGAAGMILRSFTEVLNTKDFGEGLAPAPGAP